MRRARRLASSTAAISWTRSTTCDAHLARVPKIWRTAGASNDKGACLMWAQRVIPDQVMAEARALVQKFPALGLDRDADSVDGAPTLEVMWVLDGTYIHYPLSKIFKTTVEEKLLPLIQRQYERHGMADGSKLVLCEALLRVYEHGARRVHPAHYDRDALVTAMFEIDTRSPDACHPESLMSDARADLAGPKLMDSQAERTADSHGFEGQGFYVQMGAHRSSRMPIVMAPGDVMAHSFDLQHGVEVTGGKRCSVIFWFSDCASSCSTKQRPWYRAAAEAGEPDAQYNLVRVSLPSGQTHEPRTEQPRLHP